MNKILAFFGLCSISQAEEVSAAMHAFYVKCVQNGIKEDFGVDPKPKYNPDIWWKDNFRYCLGKARKGITIVDEPKFYD